MFIFHLLIKLIYLLFSSFLNFFLHLIKLDIYLIKYHPFDKLMRIILINQNLSHFHLKTFVLFQVYAF